MNAKLHSSFCLLLLALFAASSRTPAQSVWGTALSFDGVDDYVQAGAIPLANSSFTIEAWARRDSAVGMDFIVGHGGGGTDQSLHFGFHFGSSFVLGFYDDDLWSDPGYTDTDWHHWAGTYDATNRLRCLYRDGVLIASNTAAANYQGSGALTIGRVLWAGDTEFHGSIDDVRIWNTVRSQAEIQAHMNQPLAGAEPDLLAYWKLDEGAGSNAADASSHAFNAVLVNGPTWTDSTVGRPPLSRGNALSCDGTDDYVRTTIPTLANNYTISAWIFLRGGGNTGGGKNSVGVLSATSCGSSAELMIRSQTASSTDPQHLELGRCGYFTGTSSTGVVPLNQWVHVAVTVSSTKQVTYFVNGNAAGSWDGSALYLNLGPNITLGDNTTRRFNGLLDEVQIWNKACTTAEIQAAMSRPLTGTGSNLVAYYRFDEGAGVTAYDATPNHRNGTLVNRPFRAPSNWRPVIALNSSNPFTNECHVPFVDPTTVNGSLLAIAVGRYHGLGLRADGTIAGWGAGTDNSGYPNYGQARAPLSATNVVALAVNSHESLALKADGTVVGWGWDSLLTNIPAGVTPAVAIAAGDYHSLALRANGTVVGWGANWYGETTIPSSAVNVVAIAAAYGHSLALKADGTVIGWGKNNSGESTIPASATNVVAIAAGDNHSLALRADGTVVGWGSNYSGQTTIPASATNVVAIAAGSYHSLALKADGTVVGWGGYSTDDVPADATNVVAIAAGSYSSVALRADGTAVGWGWAQYGQPSIPASAYELNLPLAVSGTVDSNVLGQYALAYSTTNALGAIGTASRTVVVADNLPPVLTLIGGNPLMVNRDVPFVDPGATATDLCTGDLTGSIVTNITVNTSVPGFYVNTFTVTDASGNMATATRTVVVAAPIVTTLPVSGMINDTATLNGTVNPNGAETTAWFEWRSAYDRDYVNRTTPQSVGSDTNAVVLTAQLSGLTPGVIYHYRLAATNSPWVAQGNEQVFWSPAVDLHGPEFLTLEYGMPFVDATTVEAFPQAIAAGAAHSLALKADGTVVSWGAGGVPPGVTNGVAIAGGGEHSLVLRADGTVVGWGWGYYDYGQTNSPASATNVVAIAAGGYHSLALKADGTVVGWGNNWYGQTNRPASVTNVVAIAAGANHSLALRADGTVVGWGDNDYGQATGVPTPAASTGIVAVAGQTLANVVAIAAGQYHSLALKADGTVVGWGAGTFVADPEDYVNYGQIIIPAGATDVVAIAAGGFHNLALKADGTVVAWGDDYFGEATVPATASNVVAIAAGGSTADGPNVGHSLALKADGSVIGWGTGGPGSSGYPHAGQSTIPPGLNLLSLPLGISGTVNTNVLGTYVLTYNCTNALGAIGTTTRTVVVAMRPIVTTEPVTEFGPATARLQGTVNPRASETLAWFEYGLGANYGLETPQLPVGNSTNAQPFNWLTGLLPWMTYHYRAVASNTLGRTAGPDALVTMPGPSMVAPSLSVLSDVTLPQGGSTSVWFTVSPAAVDVRVRSSNPVLLPDSGLVLGGSGSSRSLSLAPAPIHSGSAQVTVTASDGSRSATRAFTLTVTPQAGGGSSLLQLAQAEQVPPQTFRFQIVDAGTGSTNYAVEYRPALSPTNAWGSASNVVVTPLGGGLYQVDTVPPPGGLGFYRVKGFRLLLAAFDSADFTAEEGAGTVGPVVVFNGIYVGTVTFTWTVAQGTTWTDQVQVNGTTAVIPVPASFLSENTGIGQLQSLTLRLEGGTGFALGATTESTVAIEENDANWRGVLETTCGSLSFTLTMLQTNGSLQGRIQSEEFGFFPTNALAQLTFREATFTAVATNVCLPALAAYPSSAFTNYLDLRLDAANGPGETNVSPTRVGGAATLASKVPGRSYQDSTVSGTFLLMKAPTAPATNDVPLYPVP